MGEPPTWGTAMRAYSIDLRERVLIDCDEGMPTKQVAAKYRACPACGRCPKGKRLVMAAPHGHWKTTTLVASLRLGGLEAPTGIDGAMNGQLFLAYVKQRLVPTLREGDVVVMDNLGSHKAAGVVEAIE